MRLTKNKLRELKVYNPHNLASRAGSKLFIALTPGENGRMAHYPHWTVCGIGFKVDPNGAWFDHGDKAFSINCRANKITELNRAIQWCYDNYQIPKDQWEKDPYGGWQIKGTIERVVRNE
ncbi:hypothetical protein LCGC14_1745640 [marine sediment metagenome]|uniref:Uncharacterized protein n=1 Tax=marine sediment metagenome TaxID=412755 RepID=A0A0F9JKN9_9ZZZZ